MVGQRAHARVRGDHGRTREPHGVEHRVLRDVRDVDQDAEPVHLRDDLLAELAHAAVLGLGVAEVLARRRRVGDVVVPAVRERDVARAELVVGLEQREVAADDVAVLDADRGDELAARVDALDVVRGVGQLDLLRAELLRQPVDRLELRHRVGLRLLVVLRRPLRLADVDDEEGGVEPALAHLGDVDLPLEPLAGIDLLGGEVERDVVVRVDGEHALVDLARLLDERDFVVAGGARERRERERQREGSGRLHACLRCESVGASVRRAGRTRGLGPGPESGAGARACDPPARLARGHGAP